jgi:dihydroflavonol-4-reductase
MSNVVAVSGASGLLGGNLASALLERGVQVRALRRLDSKIAHLGHLPLDWREVNFSNVEQLADAFRGVKAVFHCAGSTAQSRWLTRQLRIANIEVSKNIVTACKLAKVSRLVHCSSTVTCGISPEAELVNEDSHLKSGHEWSRDGYTISKRIAEDHVMAAASEIDVVVVNPGYMLGPLDVKPSSGRLIIKTAKSPVIGWPSGYNNFVDVRDVAVGMIAVCNSGRRGERYILGGENMSYHAAMTLIAKAAGRRSPVFPIPWAIARIAGLVGDSIELLTGSPQDLNSSTVRYGYCKGFQFSSDKAARELGYRWRPVVETISDTIVWFRTERMLK